MAALLAAAAGVAIWQRQASTPEPVSGKAQPSGVRTAAVTGGKVERTLRLSGVTAAENFVSLITPNLRGSRGSGGGRSSGGGSGGSGGSGGASTATVQSNAGSTSSSSTSSLASTGAAMSSSGSSGSGSTASSGGSRLQAATTRGGSSRVGGGASSSRGSTGSARGSASSGSSMGSTAGSLSGGGSGPPSIGGMSRGGGDYMLVLQDLVKPGSTVKKGDVVAEFDRQYMLNRLDDYRATVIQSEASFASLKAQLDIERKAHEQTILTAKAQVDKAALDLKTVPVRSEIDSERLKLALEEAQARYKQVLAETKFREISEKSQIRSAQLDLEQTKIELRRAEANSDKMVVKAPIEGLTVMQSIFRGAEFGQIQLGDQLYPGMNFMQIVDPRSMVVNATVNQTDVEQLKLGSKARIRIDAYPDLELSGRLIAIGAMPKSGGRSSSAYVKEVAVRLKLDQMDPRVIPDLSASADVILETSEEAAVAPLAGIFKDSQSGTAFAYVREAAGWIRRQLDLGLENNIAVSVQAGLKPGDVIALEPPPAEKQK